MSYTTNNVASIRQFENKFKWLEDDRNYFVVTLCIIVLAAYGLGRLSVTGAPIILGDSDRQSGIVLVSDAEVVTDDRLTIPKEAITNETVIGSRNGARYYALDCGGVDRISEENRLYFIDAARAKAAGYTPSVQCFD